MITKTAAQEKKVLKVMEKTGRQRLEAFTALENYGWSVERAVMAIVARGIKINDSVNHPSHYTQGKVECIDAIESALGREQFIGFLRGQIIKYTWRLGRKDASAQDHAKAMWYGKKLEEVLSSSSLEVPDDKAS